MDRRMYRGNVGNNYRGRRGVSPYRPQDPVCDNIVGGRCKPDDDCRRPDYDDDCFDRNFPIGMCYVPWQRFKNLYENEFAAIKNGTIFKDLDKDWYGRGCK